MNPDDRIYASLLWPGEIESSSPDLDAARAVQPSLPGAAPEDFLPRLGAIGDTRVRYCLLREYHRRLSADHHVERRAIAETLATLMLGLLARHRDSGFTYLPPRYGNEVTGLVGALQSSHCWRDARVLMRDLLRLVTRSQPVPEGDEYAGLLLSRGMVEASLMNRDVLGSLDAGRRLVLLARLDGVRRELAAVCPNPALVAATNEWYDWIRDHLRPGEEAPAAFKASRTDN